MLITSSNTAGLETGIEDLMLGSAGHLLEVRALSHLHVATWQ